MQANDGNTDSLNSFSLSTKLAALFEPWLNQEVADHIDDRNLRLKGIPHRTNCKTF